MTNKQAEFARVSAAVALVLSAFPFLLQGGGRITGQGIGLMLFSAGMMLPLYRFIRK